MKNAFLILALFVAFSSAKAESRSVASLEWLADSSTGIGVYVLTSFKVQSESSCELTLRLEQTLKQNPPASVQSNYPLKPASNLPGTTVALGDRFLVCVGGEHGPISLTAPQPYDDSVAAITARGEVLTDSARVLRVIKSRLRKHHLKKPAEKKQSTFVQDPGGQRFSYPHSFFSSTVSDSYSIIVPQDLAPKSPPAKQRTSTPNTEEEEEAPPTRVPPA